MVNRQCRACLNATSEFMRVSSERFDEPFFDSELRSILPHIVVNRCGACGSLWAADARIDQEVLDSAYARMPGDYFSRERLPASYLEFYRRLEAIIQKHADGCTLLDVGCGDGQFLNSLSEKWKKLGLEPSTSGTKLAEELGLTVYCGTLATAGLAKESKVDVLTALDVIEHVADPSGFLSELACHINVGGLLVLLTGDPGSMSARYAGDRWSYLSWAGHVSVLSKSGLSVLLSQNGFETVEWSRCTHPASPGLTAWLRVALLEPFRRVLGRNRSWYPFWMDHQVVVARRLGSR